MGESEGVEGEGEREGEEDKGRRVIEVRGGKEGIESKREKSRMDRTRGEGGRRAQLLETHPYLGVIGFKFPLTALGFDQYIHDLLSILQKLRRER